MIVEQREINVVTGASGYTGKYITRRLIQKNIHVISLTGHPQRPHPFGDKLQTAPFSFDDVAELKRTLSGAKVLYNTYWIRFPYGGTTYEQAVENTKILFQCAKDAGVQRIVHVSIANPSIDSPFPYYRGKAQVDEYLGKLAISHAIVRPTVIYGPEDILINNMAWCLRRFPLFMIPGNGKYLIQPIFVEDMADLMVDCAIPGDNCVIDAIGPEVYTFNELLWMIREITRGYARLINIPKVLAYVGSKMVGSLVGDKILTWDEVGGLTAGLLASNDPPTGKTRLSEWLRRNADQVGKRYASELKRHYR